MSKKLQNKVARRVRCYKCQQLFDPKSMVQDVLSDKKVCLTCCKVSNEIKEAAKQQPNPTQLPSSKLTNTSGENTAPKLSQKAFTQVNSMDPVTKPTLTSRISAAREAAPKDNAPHLIIEARAGTGKTTTLVEGLNLVLGNTSRLVPSPQQAAVWEAMKQSSGVAKSICFVAFNKSIAMELQKRVPQGCEAMTMHSLGLKAIRRSFELLPRDKGINQYRVQDIVSKLLGQDIRQIRKEKMVVLRAVQDLVGLCKMNLVNPDSESFTNWQEELSDLASYYDIDLNGCSSKVFSLVPKVLERCKNIAQDRCIDYDDMIWLPVALGLSVFQYDLLLADECQDLSKCQQALARKAGKRLILCGDPKQAIYGFAGADSKSMARMYDELTDTDRGCTLLPLTVTRRCGKSIVREAQKIVSDFEAFETNSEGTVTQSSFDSKEVNRYTTLVQDGDMILSRVNAPLVRECFRFLKAGRKANIQGRDVGKGLINTINKMKVYSGSVTELITNLGLWLERETANENAKKNPSENRVISLQDKHDCILCFCEGQSTVDNVTAKIDSIFTDDKNGTGIRLSSIHKAKGLEAKRVFLFRHKEAPLPHPMAKSDWEREQEMNLLYVGITRAIEELVFVID